MKLTINIWATQNALTVAQGICRDAVLVKAGAFDYTGSVATAHIQVRDLSHCTLTITSQRFNTAQSLLEWMHVDQTLINPDTRTEEHVEFDGESYLSDLAAA